MNLSKWTHGAPVVVALLLTGCIPPGGADTVPPAPAGIRAFTGGGSGEVIVTWDPIPAAVGVAYYRVYENRLEGQYWLLAAVTSESLGTLEPGRIGIVDAPDYWPWPLLGPTRRCYVVTTVATNGRESAMSPPVCGSPP